MKKILLVLLLIFTFAFASCGKNDDTSKKDDENPVVNPDNTRKTDDTIADSYKDLAKGKKVYVTTCGQADDDIVVSVLSVAGVEDSAYSQVKTLKAADVENGAVVFLVVGSSSKGLGSAGVDVTSETKRATDFATKAKAGDITVVVFHVGGSARRGSLSDPVIREAMPAAKLALVVEGGNSDSLFTTLAASANADLYLYSKAAKMVNSIKVLFGL